MIEWKAVFFALCFACIYFCCKELKKKIESAAEESNKQKEIDSRIIFLIEELHRLSNQHTRIEQFLFDYEQEKSNTYSITYTDVTGAHKTADIIKANESDAYLKLSAEQQQQKIEASMQAISAEIYHLFQEKPHKKKSVLTSSINVDTNIEKADTNVIQTADGGTP